WVPWPRQGVRPAPQGTCARRPGVVRPADLLLAPDAGLAPAAAHHDRLDLCASVSAGRRQDRPGQRGGHPPAQSRRQRTDRSRPQAVDAEPIRSTQTAPAARSWTARMGEEMDDVFLLSRIQFALTIMFHYIFPPLSIGL